MNFTNEEVRSVRCRECGAVEKELCLGAFRIRGKWAGKQKPRITPHPIRVTDYEAYIHKPMFLARSSMDIDP